MKCFICEDTANIKECEFCNFKFCKECFMKNVEISGKLLCMNFECKKQISRGFIMRNFDKKWINNNWETKLKKHYVTIEKTYLATTQNNSNRFLNKCYVDNCKGFLDISYRCMICKQYSCEHCFLPLDKNHKCNEDSIKSLDLIRNDSKNCPVCGVLIHKIDGCNQMWCVLCHCAFSWETGKIETVIHNPHYLDWLRGEKISIPRTDYECDRKIDNPNLSFSIKNKLMDNIKLTQYTINTCVYIKKHKLLAFGTKEALYISKVTEDGEIIFQKKHNFTHWICNILYIEEFDSLYIGTFNFLYFINFSEDNINAIKLAEYDTKSYTSCISYNENKKELYTVGSLNIENKNVQNIYIWNIIDSERIEFKKKIEVELRTQGRNHIYALCYNNKYNILLYGGEINKLYWRQDSFDEENVVNLSTIATVRKILLIDDYIICLTTQSVELLRIIKKEDNIEIISVHHIKKGGYDMKYIGNNMIISAYCNDIEKKNREILLLKVENNMLYEINKIVELDSKESSIFCIEYLEEWNKVVVGKKQGFQSVSYELNINNINVKKRLLNILNWTQYLENTDKPNFNLGNYVNNEQLRFDFLNNKISDEEFENKIYESYKRYDEYTEIYNILNLYIIIITDIFYILNEETNEENFSEYLKQIDYCIDYVNSLLAENTITFDNKPKQIKYPTDNMNNQLILHPI